MGWLRRLRSTIAGSRLDRDLDAEARFHLEQRVEEYVRRGMTVAEARTQAIRRFGNVTLTQERTRDVDTFRWVHDLRQDLPLALRLLVKSPGFTATVVLSLAVGIGTNAAVFGAIDALILRRLPVRNPEQLVMFGPPDTYAIDYPLLERLRGLSSVFDGIAAIVMTDRFGMAVSGADSGVDAGVAVHLVTGNYFALMGTTAAIGRNLTPDDDRAGSQAVAVVSYAYWERRLARAPDVVGRTLRTNGTTFTIVGVAQRGFAGDRTGRPADVWIPTVMEPQIMPGCRVLRCGAEVRIIGRLRAGVGIPQAQASARIVADQFNREAYPSSPQPVARPQLKLQSAAGGYTPQLDSLAQSLIILMVVVGCVLMIACANIANLLLVRSAARQREMALRLALGAGRARIVRQLLAESLLLALTGGALGSLFAVWGMRILATALSSGPAVGVLQSRISLDAHVDARVLAFTVAICLLTGVLFGLAPAFRSSGASLSTMLGGRGAGSTSSGRRFGLGEVLVVVQVVLSLVLAVGTALSARTLRNLQGADLGVDREHLLLVWTIPVQTGRLDTQLADFWRTVGTRLSALPGVLSASASNMGVLNGFDGGGPSEVMRIRGQLPKPGMLIGWAVVAPRFFETAGMPVIAGREFTEQDNESGARVAVVNETTAHFYFGDQDPVGQRFAKPTETGYPWEIIGVVRDAKHGTPRERKAEFYSPYRQDLGHLQNMCVVVRTAGAPTGLAMRVRQELHNIDSTLPVTRIDTVEEQLNDVLVQERITTILAGFLSAISVLLACLGLYGIVAHAVVRRTNEIGIRMALGASLGDVLAMVFKQSLRLVLAGVVIGVPVALAAARLIANRLFGVTAGDPATIGGVTLLMIAVASVAGFLPARRASRVDPLVALRHE